MGSDTGALRDQTEVNIREWAGGRKQKPVRRPELCSAYLRGVFGILGKVDRPRVAADACRRQGERDRVDDWLREQLLDGPVSRERIFAAASRAGFPISGPGEATVSAARTRVKVVPARGRHHDRVLGAAGQHLG